MNDNKHTPTQKSGTAWIHAKGSRFVGRMENGKWVDLARATGRHAEAVKVAAHIVRAVNSFDAMREALRKQTQAIADIINAAQNGQAYTAAELAENFMADHEAGVSALALAGGEA